MKSRNEIFEILRKELPYLKKKFHVKTIGLFGSYAREEQAEKSDVDLLVDFKKPVDFFILIDLEDYLSNKLGVKVEVVTPGGIKERMKPYIMRDVVYV
ncbi:nucleotidyltransferase domain protein [archaeon BMS3Bbin15]|nr:nucleotidyltransferase domain protein [archaeon BMS3Bbin15]